MTFTTSQALIKDNDVGKNENITIKQLQNENSCVAIFQIQKVEKTKILKETKNQATIIYNSESEPLKSITKNITIEYIKERHLNNNNIIYHNPILCPKFSYYYFRGSRGAPS